MALACSSLTVGFRLPGHPRGRRCSFYEYLKGHKTNQKICRPTGSASRAPFFLPTLRTFLLSDLILLTGRFTSPPPPSLASDLLVPFGLGRLRGVLFSDLFDFWNQVWANPNSSKKTCFSKTLQSLNNPTRCSQGDRFWSFLEPPLASVLSMFHNS